MVNQREPPRPGSSQTQIPAATTEPQLPKLTQPFVPTSSEFKVPRPLREVINGQPQFGKTSPLRNSLKPDYSQATSQWPPQNPDRGPQLGVNKPFVQPRSNAGAQRESADVVEIPRPMNAPLRDIPAAPRPMFSSLGSQTAFEAYDPRTYNPNRYPAGTTKIFSDKHSNQVDLTQDCDGFDPDYGLNDNSDAFGAHEPLTHIEAAKANENIKALLEGAFGDEDKPKTKLRTRKAKPAEKELKTLSDKLESLQVKEGKGEDLEDEDVEDDGTVDGLSVKLLPHQVEGVAWMLEKEIGGENKNGVLPKGGILADDMGLGKTIQAVALILTNPRPSFSSPDPKSNTTIPKSATKCTLVISPLALIKQWESEIGSKVLSTHKLKVLLHHGSNRIKRSKDLEKYDVVITTYQIVASEHAGSQMDRSEGIRVGCMGVHWYRVILDEAHTIKNRNAKMTQACYALQSVYRWCLTGTPMQNNLDELQSLIKFLRIKPFHELKPWKQQIIAPLKEGRGGLSMKRLGAVLKTFMKRRTKDVLKMEGALNLAENKEDKEGEGSKGFKIVARRVESIVTQFDPDEQAFYDKLQGRMNTRLEEMMSADKQDYIKALVLLLRLRQACNHPKLVAGNAAKDKDALVNGGEKGSQTPSKAKSSKDDGVDDVANLLGGLSVTTKKCDLCQIELPSSLVAKGAIRCEECEQDLASQPKLKQRHKKQKSSKKSRKPRSQKKDQEEHSKPLARRNKKVVLDSDDEEDAKGDWVVPKSQQRMPNLGKAGGSDDENAEGGGEDLGSEDSETDEDDDERERKSTKKSGQVTNLVSSDTESDASDTEESAEEDDEEDEFSSSEDEGVNGMVASSKIRYLLDILEKETEEHKVIVFSQFTSMLDLVEPFLRNAGFVFTRYDGSMRNDAREASLNKLRNDRRTRVLLCSLRCGSLGLNLTAASRVVILEPFWNPFVEEQAIDRVHRLNQTVDVVVYKLTVANTVEERILALQEKKRELAVAALEGGKAIGKLNMQDIMDLFHHDAEHRFDANDARLARTERVLDHLGTSLADVMPPVKRKGQGRGHGRPNGENRNEHDVYGRRW
ncbi:hypothetical protein EV356DRAFT_572405 [Viridothelium virens]|uniref:SNF2 family helicase/ATPase n=1 Tax=Viridothelium virens TaxID=1048519 RepID=A0A6A6HND0_VIRVR|nr:hypothetical protein EV356DRAFT_572405 [Viridothelium virens]